MYTWKTKVFCCEPVDRWLAKTALDTLIGLGTEREELDRRKSNPFSVTVLPVLSVHQLPMRTRVFKASPLGRLNRKV